MRKNKILLFLFIILLSLPSNAQRVKKEIGQNIYVSASNFLAYPGPSQTSLTPAPEGYHPFYISHYGRHGSRYLTDSDDYRLPVKYLSKADSLGKLTPLGKDVLKRVKLISDEALERYGELTPLGALQHKQIARRMYERFPEVFADSAYIDAKSTIVIRCILSMENFLEELLLLNPKLEIHHDASYHDMYYMNLTDKKLNEKKMPQRAKVTLDEFNREHSSYSRIMESLFNDKDYIKYEVDDDDLVTRLFKLASNLQSSPLGQEITLYDIFSEDELYDNWLQTNAWWYINYGPSPLNGGTQPFSQRNLLKKIISQADSCIALGTNCANLRFGHETMVLPLTCLLDLNGYGRQIEDLNKLEEEGWINYKIFPMGANIQFIFYRKDKSDKDVIVQVLLNENEATLPLESNIAPYYPWREVREFYLKKLATFSE